MTDHDRAWQPTACILCECNCGIVVEERVAHAFPSNKHNETYLRTKAARGGHVF